MSEYQCYEWQAIDRPLTPEEQEEVERLSSHMDEVTPTRAIVTYEWGDFKHDPAQVLARYFDAFMYYANWGSQQLAFRFPRHLLDAVQLQPYLWDEVVTLERAGEYLILTIAPEDEASYEEVDYEASLGILAGVREEILNGDMRALYLAWLIAARLADYEEEEDEHENDEEEDGDGMEPPIPPGLQDLTAAQSALARFFGLDLYLIQAAAEASAPLAAGGDTPWREMLGRLPTAERDEFLLRLVHGEPHLSGVLKRRLRELAGAQKLPAAGERRRTIGELSVQADRLAKAAQRREKEAAEARRRQELQALAAREPQAWREVDELLLKKTGAAYDRAAALLRELRDLANAQDRLSQFQARLAELQAQHPRSRSLQERLQRLR